MEGGGRGTKPACRWRGISRASSERLAVAKDLIEKAGKGFEANGPAFLNVIAPCPRGWRYDPSLGVEMAKLAVVLFLASDLAGWITGQTIVVDGGQMLS